MKMLRVRVISLIAIIALVGIDRLTKRLTEAFLELNESVNVIMIGGAEVLNFTHVRNTGAAFSILSGQRVFLVLTTGLLVIGAFIFLLSDKLKGKLQVWALTLVIAGGTGNLIDRVFNGFVVDFMHVKIINFAIFNFADICAVTGSFIFLFAMLKSEIANKKMKKNDVNSDTAQDEYE